MSGTTHFGFPYFNVNSDAPDGPTQMKALADAVDTQLWSMFPSHTLASSGLTITAATGWSTAAQTYTWEIVNGLFRVQVDAVRSGATLTASSGGGLTNTLVWTIAAPYRPRMIEWGAFTSNTSHGGAHLDTLGQMYITDAHPTSTIATSDTVHTTFTFPL